MCRKSCSHMQLLSCTWNVAQGIMAGKFIRGASISGCNVDIRPSVLRAGLPQKCTGSGMILGMLEFSQPKATKTCESQTMSRQELATLRGIAAAEASCSGCNSVQTSFGMSILHSCHGPRHIRYRLSAGCLYLCNFSSRTADGIC